VIGAWFKREKQRLVLEKKFCVDTLQQVRSMYLYLNTMNETKSCVWFVYG